MSDPQSQKDLLAGWIRDRIDNFRSSQNWYRKTYFAGTMSTVIISAIITVLAGVKFAYLSEHPAAAGATVPDDVLKSIREEYQTILDEHNQKWLALRQRQPTSGSPTGGRPTA